VCLYKGIFINKGNGWLASPIPFPHPSKQNLVGSLAGAAHLLNNNTGVLREAQGEQKSPVEQKGKSFFHLHFQYEYKLCKHGLSILYSWEEGILSSHWACQNRGVRKVTKGITGLWQPSVHSDVAFWFFDVGSSYHWPAAEPKCRIVHPPTGNVSWV